MFYLDIKRKEWTQSAVECYLRGCNCDNCTIKELLESPCIMKDSVISLIRSGFKPPVKRIDVLKD